MENIPSGKEFLDPQTILKRIGIELGQIVADLGCGGAGYFTLLAARAVGAKGKVYATDVFRPALSAIASKAWLAGLRNIETVWTNLETVGAAKQIRSGSVDLAMIHNVLHQSRNHPAILKECFRMLKPGSRLLVIDWRVGDWYFGPKRMHLVSAEQITKTAHDLGLRSVLRFEPSRYHWGIIFQKESAKGAPTPHVPNKRT